MGLQVLGHDSPPLGMIQRRANGRSGAAPGPRHSFWREPLLLSSGIASRRRLVRYGMVYICTRASPAMCEPRRRRGQGFARRQALAHARGISLAGGASSPQV